MTISVDFAEVSFGFDDGCREHGCNAGADHVGTKNAERPSARPMKVAGRGRTA